MSARARRRGSTRPATAFVRSKRTRPCCGLPFAIPVAMMLAAMATPGAAFAQSCTGQCPLAALFSSITASAADQEDSTAKPADGKKLPASRRLPKRESTGSAPRWTVSAEAIVLSRIGGVNQTLVARVPGNLPFYNPPFPDSATYPGVEALNSKQFWQGFSAGPKIDLIYRGDSGYGVELSYFNIFDQSGSNAIGPDNPPDWLVMKAPGSFWQTQDFPYQAMAWKDTTSLYGAEANGRSDVSSRVTLLAGVRWLQLNDNLVGTLTPADQTEPDWKGPCSTYTLSDLSTCPFYPGRPAGTYPPFWETKTKNNLYGAQVGVDAKLLELGRFSLDGLIKAGLFDNNAAQTTVVSMAKQLYPAQATTNRAAFVGEAGLEVKYELAKGLALKAGYEALWLDGVALAPGQIEETYTTALPKTSARALGVNCGSNVLFQGATFGLEYPF